MWRRHRDLLSNVITLAGTTGVTSGLGFVYWAVAARLFSTRAVGYGSAAISAMGMLGTIGMVGLGTLLIGELPRRRPRGGLLSAALLFSGAVSLMLGLGFVLIARLVTRSFADTDDDIARAVLFTVGVALTAMMAVFDQATIGLLRGGLQLSRNIAFSVIKLLALPAAAWVLHDGLGVGIILSWVAGTALSLVPVAIRLRWGSGPTSLRPDWTLLRRLGRTTLAHNWLNLALAIRQSIIPVLVTIAVSATANAAFYAAWMLAGFLSLVPSHLSTVLFAVASDPQEAPRKIRFTLRLSLMIGLPGMAVLAVSAHFLLSLFGARYATAAIFPLWMLIIAYLPGVPLAHYIAVSRIRGRMARAAGVMAISVVMEALATVVGGKMGGLDGVAIALLGVRTAEGLVTLPAVITTAMGRGRHRKGDAQALVMTDAPSPAVTDMRKREQQQAGLAALLALSITTTSPMPIVQIPQQSWSRQRGRTSEYDR